MGKRLLYALGRPFSPLYGGAMRIRETGYRRGLFRVSRFPVPVISVGNLTMGGTGKTPLVQHLSRLLLKQEWRPAVISRGYGGATREPVNVVSDGKKLLLSAEKVGDEPRLLAETLPGVMVLTGVVRRLPAARAVDMGADVLILDDGFQHLAVARDLDLVLFSADTLAGNSRIFPGGDLREPVKALNRCQAFVLTGVRKDNRERSERFAALLRDRFPGRPVFFNGYRHAGFVRRRPDGGLETAPAPGNGERVLALCGIAWPDGFRNDLRQVGMDPAQFLALPDHHHYKEADLKRIGRIVRANRISLVVTTEKDLVKLDRADFGVDIVALRREVNPDPALEQMVMERLGNHTPNRPGQAVEGVD